MDFLYPPLFAIFAVVVAFSAIAMVVTQNIVRAATWLLFTLAGVAGLFFLLGADFVGATQLLVYVGGTLVLVVFGVMLTAQGPFINLRIAAGEWAIAAAVGISFFSVLAYVLTGLQPVPNTMPAGYTATLAQGAALGSPALAAKEPSTPKHRLDGSIILGESLLGYRSATPIAPLTGVRNLEEEPLRLSRMPGSESQRIPYRPKERRRMSYVLPFEIVSVHLLVVLIGAAYLARSKRRRGETA